MDSAEYKAKGEGFQEQVFVARQPIFDTKMKVWGYELLYRHAGEAGEASFADGDMATSQVIADGVTLGRTGLAPGEKTLVNFPEKLLLAGFGFALPPESCVIEILETVTPSPEILAALGKLKHAGYTLALDDFVGQPEHAPFLEVADIVKVDVLGTPPGDLPRLAAKLGGGKRTLLAEKVEDAAMHLRALDMGFSLFQGYFFQKPELVQGRKMSSSEMSKLKLLKELADEDFDPGKVSRIIETDLSLSYRLLRYINSASFGRRDAIDSIRQAIMVLGQRNLSKWLQAVLMSDLNPTPKGKELVFLSVRRAKFLELLGRMLREPPARPDALFVLGLFSLLDALLGQPMDEIIKDLPLTAELAEALKGGQNQARELLTLAEGLEQADWKSVKVVLDALKVPAVTASALQADALRFAGELVRDVCTLPPAKGAGR
ncbi:EAL and HDOD domain-containing protein [Fundidesulfovibrio terrae]|uniref:EAL and HDOD domain-containing protein n=1 Tax=Fundidesulfovibrio terrae TaxID=2922866 RepID=UPI001FAF4E3E|nr:HDOD domain-containing protein [Fundidesulfovibrio terrae]